AGDRDAIDTLHTVLEVTCRTVAPLLPLTAEAVWRGLTGGRSVHLADWPEVDELPADAALVSAMDQVRQVCSAALGLRKANKLRVRLPLAELRVATPEAEELRPVVDLIRDEVNVKEVVLSTDVAAYGRFEVAVKAGDWSRTPEGKVVAAGIELLPEEFTERLVSTDTGASTALPNGAGLVSLETEVTPELAAEGLARDVVRVIQQARREADFAVSDRITVTISAPQQVQEAVAAHREFIAEETLAESVEFGDADGFAGSVGDGTEIAVAVAKV